MARKIPTSQDFTQIIDQFITEILTESGVVNSPAEENLREAVWERIEDRLFILITDSLPEEQFLELHTALEQDDLTEEQELDAYTTAAMHIPEFSRKFVDMLQELKQELVQDAADLRAAVDSDLQSADTGPVSAESITT